MIRTYSTALLAVICGLLASALCASHPVFSVETWVTVEEVNGSAATWLTDNDAAALGRDFGPVVVASSSGALAIRVGNAASSPDLLVTDTLIVTVPTVTAGAADFSINTAGFGTSFTPGQNTTFTVTFNPSSAGTKTGQISFTYQPEPVANPGTFVTFRVNVIGDGISTAVPRVHLAEQATPTTRVFENQAAGYGRAFGSRVYWGVPTATVTLVITNSGQTGAGNLTLSTPAFNPATSDYVLDTTGYSNSVAQGASTSFSVAFNPVGLGSLPAMITFTHNDTFETSPFTINFSGTGLADPALIRVTDSAGPYWGANPGTGFPTPFIGTSLFEDNGATGGGTVLDFGPVNVGNQGYITITICHAGQGGIGHSTNYEAGPNLTLGMPTPQAGDFATAVTGNYNTNLLEAESTDFLIGFTPTAAGSQSATILLPHGDGTVRTPWRINVTGTGVTGNANPTITANAGAASVSSGAILTVAPGSTLAAVLLSITVADADGDPTSLAGTVSNIGTTGVLQSEFSSVSAAVPYTLNPASGTFGAAGTTHTVLLQANDGSGGTAVLGFTINVANPTSPNNKKSNDNGCAAHDGPALGWLALLAPSATLALMRRRRA